MIKQKQITFYDWKSKRLNLSFYVISSWLQKSIRRWNFNDSLVYTQELLEAWHQKYIWKKIFTYLVEDIGFWNLYIWELILSFYSKYQETETEREFNEVFIYQTIYILCNSYKNREIDNFFNSWWITKEDQNFLLKYCNPEIYNSKSKKVRDKVLKELEIFQTWKESIFRVYKDCCIKLWDLNWKDSLNLYFIFFYLLRDFNLKSTFTENQLNYIENLKKQRISINIENIYKQFSIKDYVYDKHTYEWKKLWRWTEHFFLEGAFLKNKVVVNWNKYEKFLYKNLNL